MPLTEAEYYLNNLDSNIWIPFSGIPEKIFNEVWELIESRSYIIVGNDEKAEEECFKKVYFETNKF